MTRSHILSTLAQWGRYLEKDLPYQEELWHRAKAENGWFTLESIQQASRAILEHMLQEDTLHEWLEKYNDRPHPTTAKNNGLVLAGNLPLVGFHDILSVLAAGHQAQVKLSSKDKVLLTYWVERLAEIEPALAARIQWVEKLQDFDAVIATGNNNSARYFEYYFGKVPHIIRKNRSSVAVLTGHETAEDIDALARDMFTYFGLGCRNVSKWFVPEGMEVTPILDKLQGWEHLMDHHKWKNNYDYHRSILLLNKTPHLATDFMMLQEAEAVSTPLSIIHYTRYTNREDLELQLAQQKDDIQCIVSKDETIPGALPLGTSQQPQLWDYADNVDTLDFLLSL